LKAYELLVNVAGVGKSVNRTDQKFGGDSDDLFCVFNPRIVRRVSDRQTTVPTTRSAMAVRSMPS
jgi:hypothetical protein